MWRIFLQDYNKASDNMWEVQKLEKSDGEICEQLYLPGYPALPCSGDQPGQGRVRFFLAFFFLAGQGKT
jgi:hypothetical protein